MSARLFFLCILAVSSLILSARVTASEPSASSALVLVFDASGSMWGQIGGENKIVIARRVLGGLVDGLADGSEVGVIAYGHRREGDCADIETVIPMGPLDKAAVKERVDGLNPKGKTPITASVEAAFDELRGRQGPATVLLVSDGLETCGGDPCAAVRAARDEGIEFVMHVVGFDVAGEDVSSLECMAQAGDGLFASAESAEELAGALETAVAMTPEVPAGRLSVKVVADGELQDATVLVAAADGSEAGAGRTYSSADTNPRVIPLADGRYEARVRAAGIRGDTERRFEFEIRDGSIVEREFDFSTGVVSIGVTRNGELSDAVYRLYLPGTETEVAGGRTYTAATSNPAEVRVVAGTYDLWVSSVEISNRPEATIAGVVVEPRGRVELAHEFESGTLKLGAARGGELVDATLQVYDLGKGRPVAQGRTYTNPNSNPKTFLLAPGEYEVSVQEIRGADSSLRVTIGKGETVERMVDPGGG